MSRSSNYFYGNLIAFFIVYEIGYSRDKSLQTRYIMLKAMGTLDGLRRIQGLQPIFMYEWLEFIIENKHRDNSTSSKFIRLAYFQGLYKGYSTGLDFYAEEKKIQITLINCGIIEEYDANYWSYFLENKKSMTKLDINNNVVIKGINNQEILSYYKR